MRAQDPEPNEKFVTVMPTGTKTQGKIRY